MFYLKFSDTASRERAVKFPIFLMVSFLANLSLANASGEHAPTSHPPQSAAKESHSLHWAYGGEAGPEHWGELTPDYKICEQGKLQSPIDLIWKKQSGQRSLIFYYTSTTYDVVDNGHTIQVNVPAGNYAEIDGKRFELVQFHFHAASEHTFSGKHFPLEAHFVHKNKEGKLAVVGVMFEAGKADPNLAKIFHNVPKKAGEKIEVSSTVNPISLIPSNHSHYQYMGSLTTPPCSEGVNWTVLNTPKEISEEQIQIFNEYYAHNNRPLQAIHERSPASSY